MMLCTPPCRRPLPIDCRNRSVELLHPLPPGGENSFEANHETDFPKFFLITCLRTATAVVALRARVSTGIGRALHSHVRALPLARVFTRTGMERAGLETAYLRLYANGDPRLADKSLLAHDAGLRSRAELARSRTVDILPPKHSGHEYFADPAATTGVRDFLFGLGWIVTLAMLCGGLAGWFYLFVRGKHALNRHSRLLDSERIARLEI